jgi:hypothetical protein
MWFGNGRGLVGLARRGRASVVHMYRPSLRLRLPHRLVRTLTHSHVVGKLTFHVQSILWCDAIIFFAIVDFVQRFAEVASSP